MRAAFAALGSRVTFHGAVGDRDALARLYAGADLLVWPAVREAYGMALLEAQAQGTPVLAGNHGGVAAVVRDGTTGRLVAPDDVAAFTAALRDLLDDPDTLRRMSDGALRFARGERGLDSAAAVLRDALASLTERAA